MRPARRSRRIRWYEDGLLVRRFVSRHMTGYWSLSPTGDGPRVTIRGNSNWWTDYPVPGDEGSEQSLGAAAPRPAAEVSRPLRPPR